jgi:hypothetical protein
MSTNPLYDAWKAWLEQFLPDERITRIRTAACVVMGLFESRSVHLSEIAAEVPGEAKLLSQERRIARLLNNPACNPKRWYKKVACWWLEWVGRTQGEIVLIVDGTRVSTHHQLLMVALALRGRAMPIAWTWVNGSRGHSSRPKQLALLARVHRYVPAGVAVTVVGDTEFGAVEVMRHLSEVWHWNYVLRQKSNNQVRLSPDGEWQDFENLVTYAGSKCFRANALLTRKHAFPTALLAIWKQGEKDCWLLASSFPTEGQALSYYGQRMLIEEMFGDLKGHGFDLEHTRLRHIHRLGRLTLLVCLLYAWLLRTGLEITISGKRHLVDRKERRDNSFFRLGLYYIKRLLNNSIPFRVWICPDNLYDRLLCDQVKLSGS